MRTGRPRKSMAPRKPCGRLRQTPAEPDNAWPTPEVMARRKALLGSASARGELECPITLLGARLDQDQAYAARKARSIYDRHAVAIQPPRVVIGSLRDYVQGSGAGSALAPDAADRFKADFEELRRAVLREVRWRFRLNPDRAAPAARQAWRELQSLMQGRLPRNQSALIYALDAIVLYYDLARNDQSTDRRDSRRAAA